MNCWQIVNLILWSFWLFEDNVEQEFGLGKGNDDESFGPNASKGDAQHYRVTPRKQHRTPRSPDTQPQSKTTT